MVGIADPVKYRKRLEAVEVFKRQQEVWAVHLSSDRSSLTQILQDAGNVTIADADQAMYGHASNQSVEFRNRRLKHQRSHKRHDAGKAPSNEGTKVGDMDRAAAALIHTRTKMGRSTTVGDVEYFLRRMESDSTTAAALYNAQRTLAYERAKFTADCAARNIRTTVDAEKAWKCIAVARVEVVRQEI